MKKLLICLCLILVMIFALSACKTDDEDNATSEENNQENVVTHTHTPSDWIIDGDVSCNTNGNRHIECIECHEILQSEIAYAEGHKMKNGVCTVCEKTFSSGLEFTSLGGGKCYVSGIGECQDSELFIPPTSPDGDKVAYIGEDAFRDCTGITGVEISEGITSIGFSAFNGCSDINNVFLPKTLVLIDDYAFTECENLQTIRLGDALTEIGFEAFGYCDSLKEIVVPDSVAYISENAFLKCKSLESVKFGKNSNLETIGNSAFQSCEALAEIAVPDSTVTIGKSAFFECKALKRAVVGNGVEIIDDYAFTNCESLQELTLGDSLKEIRFEAFGYCYALNNVTLPESLWEIHNNAFLNCKGLEKVDFSFCKNLGRIGESAFASCITLKEAILPECLMILEKSAFSNCTELTRVVICGNVTRIDDYAFSECKDLSDLVIKEGVMTIGFRAFGDCTSLESVTIPQGVVEIEKEAFIGCSSLSQTILPESLRFLGLGVFYFCNDIHRIFYYGSEARWKNINFDGMESYTTSGTPYYYTPFKAPYEGDYWGFDENGEMIIWGISTDGYLADYYSQNFLDACIDGKTLGSILLDEIESEMMDTIYLWNTLHIAANADFIFDPDHALITKKDIYKYVLYDIFTGEHAEKSFYEMYDTATMNAFNDVAKMFLGGIELKDFKIGDLKSVLKNITDFKIDDSFLAALESDEVDTLLFFINMSESAYEATQYISRYYALRNIEKEYITVLEEIVFNNYNPDALREAAAELIECYEAAFKMSAEEFARMAEQEGYKDAFIKEIQNKAFDFLKKADPTGLLTTLSIEGKIVLALLEPLGINKTVESYYKLKCLNAVEQATMNIVRTDHIDFYKYEADTKSAVYMASVSLLQKVILMENDYSVMFFKDYYKADMTPDPVEEYRNLINRINESTNNYINLFKSFDNNAKKIFESYYENSMN